MPVCFLSIIKLSHHKKKSKKSKKDLKNKPKYNNITVYEVKWSWWL